MQATVVADVHALVSQRIAPRDDEEVRSDNPKLRPLNVTDTTPSAGAFHNVAWVDTVGASNVNAIEDVLPWRLMYKKLCRVAAAAANMLYTLLYDVHEVVSAAARDAQTEGDRSTAPKLRPETDILPAAVEAKFVGNVHETTIGVGTAYVSTARANAGV
jgi:hypothetical protein